MVFNHGVRRKLVVRHVIGEGAKTMKRQMIALAALAALTGSALAYSTTWDTANNTVTYTETGIVDSNMGSGGAVTVNLPGFDSDDAVNAGEWGGQTYVLTEVVVTINGELEYSITVNSNTDSPAEYTVSISGDGAIVETGIYKATEKYIASSTLNLAAFGSDTWAGNDPGDDNGSSTYTDATALAYFTTDQDLAFTVNYRLSLLVDGPNYSSSTFGEGTATISVQYFYEPIPEPSTWALIGVGGLAIVLRRRFGKRTPKC